MIGLAENSGEQGCGSGGSLLPGRNFSSDAYRFGFQGQEKDNEVYGATGTAMTAQFWEYDTRTGRRWNLDPKPQRSISDYSVMGLTSIFNTDLLGDKWKTTADAHKAESAKKKLAGREAKYT